MTLEPLLAAPRIVVLHAAAAMTALPLGAIQLTAAKGTRRHHALGWLWAALLATVAISSFWINTIRQFGPFSLIHLLSIFTLLVLPLALIQAHRHRIRSHATGMILLFVGGLVIAGAFTLYPHRIMNRVVFGAHPMSQR